MNTVKGIIVEIINLPIKILIGIALVIFSLRGKYLPKEVMGVLSVKDNIPNTRIIPFRDIVGSVRDK